MSRIGAAAIALAIDESLKQTGYATLRAQGRSMWPWVLPGVEISLCRVEADHVSPGDLALYRRGEGLVLHRAIRREVGAWWMRGDAQRAGERVRDDAILARAEGVHLGRLALRGLPRWAERCAGRFLVSTAPILSHALKQTARARHRLRVKPPRVS